LLPDEISSERAMANSPHTISVPEAGKIYFGIGRRASYEAAARGEIPVIKIGKFLRVPVKAVEKMLDPKSPEAA
jgi:hypothetical protein